MVFSRSLLTFVVLILLSGVSGLLPPSALATDDDSVDPRKTERELKQIKNRIKALQQQISKTRKRRSEFEQSLRAAEQQIGAVKRKLRHIRQQLANSTQAIEHLQQQQKHLEHQQHTQKSALIRDIQAAYRTGRQEYLKLLLNQQEPEKLARVLKYYEYFHQARLQRIQEYNKVLLEITENRENLKNEVARLNRLQESLQQRKAELETAQKSRKQALASLNKALDTKDKHLKSLQSSQQELQKLLKALRETLADLPSNIGNTPFNKARGKLRWPVAGRITNRFGSRREGGKLRWNGVFIKAQPGSPVKAVHRGRVVFSDWMRGYGLLTIIDHGDDYLSLYAHNESLLKEPGDWVEANETIAYAGNSGGNSKTGLYFEIRHRGRPKNPSIWCRH